MDSKVPQIFKYQSSLYNVQSNSDVDHRGMKMIWNDKIFTSLNILMSNHLYMQAREL